MISVHEASVGRWADVAQVMGTRGDPARCWCQYFRLRGSDWRAATSRTNRAALQAQVVSGDPSPGVLAYIDDEPAGWCAVAPRRSYPRLAHSTVSQATQDAGGVWAVPCFVVRVGARRRGLAGALLDGAVRLAGRHGARVVEAYPVDTAQRAAVSSSELYHGPLSVFLRAGFVAVARPVPGRVVVRRTH